MPASDRSRKLRLRLSKLPLNLAASVLSAESFTRVVNSISKRECFVT